MAHRVHVHASERWKTGMVQLKLHPAQLRRAGANELLLPIIHRLLPRKRQNSRCAQRHCALSAGIESVLESGTSVNCQFAPVCTLAGTARLWVSFAVERGRSAQIDYRYVGGNTKNSSCANVEQPYTSQLLTMHHTNCNNYDDRAALALTLALMT